jgi:putative membrane protein
VKRIATCAGVSLLSVAAVLGSGGASASAATAPSAQDVSWMQGNAQTDMAEIAIGTTAETRAVSTVIKNLATVTKSNHIQALAQLKSVAAAAGVTLPTAPNATQQAQGAQLMSIPDAQFDLTYDNDQIAGHELSISQTETEISTGSDPAVVAYAKVYLPVAQMHLQMADSAHAVLTGSTTVAPSVQAGSGGMAATHAPDDTVWFALIGLGAVIGVGSGGYGLRRRQSSR